MKLYFTDIYNIEEVKYLHRTKNNGRRSFMSENQITIQPEESYKIIRESVLTAQSKVYTVVNSAMVQAYWEIGQEIHKACGENDRAGYGKKLLEYLSEQLTKEFGKGFTVANLKNMRQFYRTFPIRQTLSSELSWSHYNLLIIYKHLNYSF